MNIFNTFLLVVKLTLVLVLSTTCLSFYVHVSFHPPFAPHSDINKQTIGRSCISSLNMQVWCDCRQIISDDIKVKLETMKEEPDFIFATKDSIVPSFPNCKKQLIINSKDSLVINPDNGQTIGVLVNIQNPADQESAMATLGSVQWLVVQCQSTTWQMIPAENLISAAQATGTKLAFCINDPSHVGGLARALELGVDALCVDAAVASKELWDAVFEARQERLLNDVVQNSESYTDANGVLFENGYCWRRSVQSTILADRICVDLVQTLLPEEGCWIGSSAKINALVLSEAASSQYVPTRPFRINAGPVHSYILMQDQTTKYLCELKPGDQVEVYNFLTGSRRNVAVGRLKQELRPCILIELESCDGSQRGQVFLQHAETVRLAQPNGDFVRVTGLESQMSKNVNSTTPVLLRLTTKGTHVGKAYGGLVKEK